MDKIMRRIVCLPPSNVVSMKKRCHFAMAAILLMAACGLTSAKEPAGKNKVQAQQTAFGKNEPEYFFRHKKIDDSEKPVAYLYSIADLVIPTSEEDRAKAEVAGTYIPPVISVDTLVQDIEQIFISMLPPDRLEEKLLKKYKIDVPSEKTTKEKVNRAAIRPNLETGSIVIRAPQSVHEEIGKRLNAYRTSGRYQITTAPIFFSAQANIADSLGIKWDEGKTDESPPSVVRGEWIEKIGEPAPAELPESVKAFPIRTALLTKKQWHRFILSAQKDKDADILFAPQATLLNGQKALLVDKGQHPLIPVLSATGAVELKPRYVGTEIALRTSLNEDQSTILLHVKYVRSRIKKYEDCTVTIKGKNTSMQVPQINTRAIQFGVKLEDSQALLIEHEHVEGNNKRHYLLLTVDKVRE